MELPSKRLWMGVMLRRLGLAPCSSPALPCSLVALASSILLDLMVGVPPLPALGPLLLRPRPPDLFTASERRREDLEWLRYSMAALTLVESFKPLPSQTESPDLEVAEPPP